MKYKNIEEKLCIEVLTRQDRFGSNFNRREQSYFL